MKEQTTRKPGPGWKKLYGPVWEHQTGVRIHITGLLIRSAEGEITKVKQDYKGPLHQLIRINGGNVKRGLMAFALDREGVKIRRAEGVENA